MNGESEVEVAGAITIVDRLGELVRSIDRMPGAGSLSEPMMAIAGGLDKIANAIENLADAVLRAH